MADSLTIRFAMLVLRGRFLCAPESTDKTERLNSYHERSNSSLLCEDANDQLVGF